MSLRAQLQSGITDRLRTHVATTRPVDELVALIGDEDEYLASLAVELLVGLRAVEVVEPALAALEVAEPAGWLADAVFRLLPLLGAAVVEPALRRYAENTDDEVRRDLAAVLCDAGVRDERIFAVLVEVLERDPDHGASCLHGYGDPAALPHLHRAFAACHLDEEGVLANQVVVELQAAIEVLGGKLTPDEERKFDRAMAPRTQLAEWKRRAMLAERKTDAFGPPRPERNEPCWCGSAKKYKKCHLQEDERRERAQRHDLL